MALLLVGHGGFGVSHLQDQEWTEYLGVLGLGAGSVRAWHLIVVVGWFEVALGLAVLVTPSRRLVPTVLAWKVTTELLRPLAGESVWEFIERGGDYFLPLALFLVYGWLAAPAPRHEGSSSLAQSAPAALEGDPSAEKVPNPLGSSPTAPARWAHRQARGPRGRRSPPGPAPGRG